MEQDDTLLSYLKNRINSAIQFKKIKQAYSILFGNKVDRYTQLVLNDLKMRFGYYNIRPVKAGRSEYDAGFHEGQRSVVLHILGMSMKVPTEDDQDLETMMKIINNEV